MRKKKNREVGEIFIWNWGNQPRKFIKTQSGIITYAVYLAKNNPDICGEWFEGCEVHHKDFNRLNDVAENLICLTPEEHHRIHRIQYGKQVIGWYKGKIIGIWGSMTQASNETKCSLPSISYYCKHQHPKSNTYIDYQFMYLDEWLADWWEKEMDKAVS